jgi:Ca-activated chloride channel homolog
MDRAAGVRSLRGWWCRAGRRAAVAGLAMMGAASVSAQGTSPSSPQAAPDAAALPQTVLIVDGSGSMWGKLDGDKLTKLVQTRDAVRAALGKANPAATQLGLMSYGHRREADCSDVHLIAPVESAAAPSFTERIMTPLEKLNPKGKGPLTTALREAAKVLGKGTGPRSIVLVHDDPDNCQQDACAALADLQQSAPGVVVHVIGLGLKPEFATRYQCLTKPTGGQHVDIQDGGKIAAALSDVLSIALEGGRVADEAIKVAAASAPPPAAAPSPVTPLDVSKDGPPALKLRALAAKGVAATGHRVVWSVWPEHSRAGDAPLFTAEGVEARLDVKPAAYRVRAQSGLMITEIMVTAALQGETPAEAVFDAGEIRLRTPLPADATVLIARKGATSEPAQLWPRGRTALLVPPGTLQVRYEQGELRIERSLVVGAGQSVAIDGTEPGGRVLLDLAPLAGPAVRQSVAEQPVVFTIAEDDPDAPMGRRELARSAASTAEFVVPPGTYIVAAARHGLSVRERVTVAAGDTVRRTLPLMAARIALGARLDGAATAADSEGQSDVFRVGRIDSAGDEMLLVPGPAALVDVPPGRYRITARRNPAAIDAQQEVDVKAGEFKAVTLDYRVGALRLDVQLKPEAGAQAPAWHVLDAEGHLVWSSYEPAPTVLLPAGRYTLRTAVRGAQREQPVEIRDGQITSLRVVQP